MKSFLFLSEHFKDFICRIELCSERSITTPLKFYLLLIISSHNAIPVASVLILNVI